METLNTEKLENIIFWTRSADAWFADMVWKLASINAGSCNDDDEFWTNSAICNLKSGLSSLRILESFL